MESHYSVKISLPKDQFSKSDVLTISALLCRLVAARCNVPPDKLGCGIEISSSRQSVCFSSTDDLAAGFPPLSPVNGFRVTVVFNPFSFQSAPSLSLLVSKQLGDASAQVLVAVSSVTEAQEFALQIVRGLSEAFPGASLKKQDQGAKPVKAHSDKDQDDIGRKTLHWTMAGVIVAILFGLASVAVSVLIAKCF